MKNKTLIKYFNDKNFSQNLKNKQFLIDNKNKQKIKLNFKKEKNNIYNLIKLEKVRSIINSFLFKDRINLKMIKQFEENYSVRDKQDALAMCALQIASKKTQKSINENNLNKSLENKLMHLNELLKEI